MKDVKTLLLLTPLLFATFAYGQSPKSSAVAAATATAAAPQSSASGTPSTPPTIASAIDREISIIEKELVETAEAMPEDKFDFSPEKLNISGSDYKGVRTFGQQLKHVAASHYLIWSPIPARKPPRAAYGASRFQLVSVRRYWRAGAELAERRRLRCMSRKPLLLVAAASASFAPQRIRLRPYRISWQMLCWACRGDDFLLANGAEG